jgi:hypothetical protein
MLFMALVALLVTPFASYGGASRPCVDADTGETGGATKVMLAAENDLPCHVGGKYVGNCSRNKPYYNAFSGECYPTLQECKKADGDLSSTQGSGGCVRCGR